MGGQTTAGGRTKAGRAPDSGRRTVATLRLPFVTAEVWLPRLRVPDVRRGRGLEPLLPQVALPRVSRREVGDAARVVTSHLPPGEQLAYYTGLGAMALLQVVEWPVAVALGVSGVMAGRQARREVESASRARAGTVPRQASAAPRQRSSAAPRQRTTRSPS